MAINSKQMDDFFRKTQITYIGTIRIENKENNIQKVL